MSLYFQTNILDMDHRIPVTLLTGFLGSGKTTLLNKLLNHKGMKDTAVVINELGSTGLDHILSKHLERTVESQHIADNTVLLESGCLCCTLTNEMADTLRDLFFKRALGAIPEFKRLIIETTGLADPVPIMGSLLNEPVIGSTYRLDAVVVTVDSIYGIEQIAQHQEAKKQVAVADVLLLTKPDLASSEQIENLQNTLSELNSGASQYRNEQGNIEPANIIDIGLFDAEKQATPQRWLKAPAKPKGLLGNNHSSAIKSFTIALPSPLNYDQLEPKLEWLCEHHGEQLLRMKGILHVDDQPAPLAIHAVHKTLYTPTLLNDWTEEPAISRLVLIGENLNEDAIRKELMKV
jgi:G3E family GTPase